MERSAWLWAVYFFSTHRHLRNHFVRKVFREKKTVSYIRENLYYILYEFVYTNTLCGCVYMCTERKGLLV